MPVFKSLLHGAGDNRTDAVWDFCAKNAEGLFLKVGERFIYRIENEGKKPSYDILYKLIRELSILPDQIFFPEKQIEDSEMETLVRMLYNCDERSMQIIKATIKAALDSQPKE